MFYTYSVLLLLQYNQSISYLFVKVLSRPTYKQDRMHILKRTNKTPRTLTVAL